MKTASWLGLILLASLPDVTFALDPLACEMEASTQGGFAKLAAPTDVGSGFVAHVATLAIPGTYTTRVILTDCASGQSIEALTRSETDSQTVIAPLDPVAVLQAAIAAPETFGFDDVLTQLQDAGVSVELRMRDTETCGCAAFYPDLRGDKPAWSTR